MSNGKDVSARFTMDGTVIETQYGRGFVGQAMYLYVFLSSSLFGVWVAGLDLKLGRERKRVSESEPKEILIRFK